MAGQEAALPAGILVAKDGADRDSTVVTMAQVRYDLRGPEQLAFFVPAREGHDDYLMSLALCAWTAASSPPPLSETILPAIDRHGRAQAEQEGDDFVGASQVARRWDEVY